MKDKGVEKGLLVGRKYQTFGFGGLYGRGNREVGKRFCDVGKSGRRILGGRSPQEAALHYEYSGEDATRLGWGGERRSGSARSSMHRHPFAASGLHNDRIDIWQLELRGCRDDRQVAA